MSTNRTFKAIQVKEFGEPNVMKLVELPIFKPEQSQVLVKIEACGVNPVETYKRSGQYAAHLLPKLPWTPGMDGAGVIESVGSDVTNVKAGDRVWLSNSITGTYAQYCLASSNSVHTLPDNYSFEQGAALWTAYATAYHAIHHIGETKEGSKIFIHGASGGVGTAAVQLSKLIPKTTVAGTAGTEEGKKAVKECGADVVINHKEEGYLQMLKEKCPTFDVILEMLANVNLGKDMDLLSRLGRVCVIGNRGTIPVSINARALMQNRASIRGVGLGQATSEELGEIAKAITSFLISKGINPIVGKSFPLSEAAKAHVEIMDPKGGAIGKLVLKTWE